MVSDTAVYTTLANVFQALFIGDLHRQSDLLNILPEATKSIYRHSMAEETQTFSCSPENNHLRAEDIVYNSLGFCIVRGPSTLRSAGAGVFVCKGRVQKGAVVSMYPGTVYQNYEPIFFQSIGNQFIFRCLDGTFIDGNDKGISKTVYRSCSRRDQLGPLKFCDVTWLTQCPYNPLAVGQYVNNCSNEYAANVCYQEFNVPASFPVELRQYLPNINYSHDIEGPLRCVVLIALKDIGCGEELFSNYFTFVR
ncbi:SET domain-containing 9 [Pelobates cultripes]|uniref:SET domain-containing 9 n=1 Tax=Pelobates cultripes TaxID=61616 RepID=A0AAD1W6W5_PELCU|nr:SET domain-containing 9 [Pelobates cultripes]